MSRGKPKPEKKRASPSLNWKPNVEWMSYVSPAGLCICCGILVVWLKVPSGRAVPVLWYSWDGNPSYNPKKHRLHSDERYDAYLESLPKKDAMFCLDDSDVSGDHPPVALLSEDDEAFVPYSE